MIRKITGNEKTMFEKTVAELSKNASANKFRSSSVSVQRGRNIVILKHIQKNPDKSFLIIQKTVDPNTTYVRDRATIDIDNNSGNMVIKKSFSEFLTIRKILKKTAQFLKDVQPESRSNPKSVQTSSYGTSREKIGESITEKYKDHSVIFYDSY